ncbi:MAG TPA: hypothetical protein VN048_10080 [Verrucomicrobiae bacterium]|nr:hypothetical protein [Verrucomicrobiae bacterium]
MKAKRFSTCKGGFLAVLLLAGNLCAAAGFDTSSPLNYFSSVADKFLRARAGLSVTNIPIYPTNCYTPSVHRLLQLAANIYDASTNKTSAAPDDFDYPSVFRPVLGISSADEATNIFISGYVEVTNTNESTADYNFPAYSLAVPSDLAAVVSEITAGSNNFNVYEIPWVIGAKQGLPNFNQISLESFSALTRKLQIVKPSLAAARSTWHTNVQYVLAITNALMVEAWNSYANPYPRGVDIGVNDTLNMILTNENGIITPATIFSSNVSFGMQLPTIAASNWAGVGPNIALNIAPSFRFPLLSSVTFLPGDIYSTNTVRTGTFAYVANPLEAGFETTTGYPLPQFGLNITNRVRFVMVDHTSGRVIDYVQLDGLGGQRSLTSFAELHGNDDWGPGGVWDTNREPIGAGNLNSPLNGIENQISVSLQPPPYESPGYVTPVTSHDWNTNVIQSMGFSSIAAAVASFNAFFNRNTNLNSFITMQVPFTPTRTVCVYYTWQANDPLVHYTLSDLTDLIDSGGSPQTNWVYDNLILTNLGQINERYMPWGGGLFFGNPDYTTNLTLKDPMVTRSDDWNFPAGSLDFSSIGSVHRGTPWQTVYLKSSPVNPTLWQNWTGNASPSDAAISQPKNDWRLMALLAPLLNPVDPRQLFSVNQPDFAALLDGFTVLTNSIPPAYLVMSANSPQAAIIAAGVSALRASQPGGIFTNVGDVLAAPELSVNSPWFDPGGNGYLLTDSDYELIPSQLLALLRTDSVGSATPANGLLQIQFTGMDGYAYEVDASTNLTDWIPLATEYTTNGAFVFTDPTGTGLSKRYYRTSLLPNN